MRASPPRHSGFASSTRPGTTSQRPAAIDDMRDAGRERTLVAGEVNGERGDFLRGAEPSHRLPAHEHLAPARPCGSGAVEHRRRLDGAGTDTIAADGPGDEIDSNR